MNEVTHVPNRSAAMNGRGKLEGLQLSRIFERGLAEHVNENDAWHEEDRADWCWHASSLAGCPRELILRRAGLANDGITLSAALNFQLSHAYHGMLERSCLAYERSEPRFKVLAVEAGGRHPGLPLKARCDLLFTWDGEPVLCDLKMEHPNARSRRREEATQMGFEYPYKVEHAVQVAAQAEITEALVPGIVIRQARLLYINKANFDADQVPVPISRHDMKRVGYRVEYLERCWTAYQHNGTLPPPLTQQDEIWRCQPRSDTDPMGKWCQARRSCFGLRNLRSVA